MVSIHFRQPNGNFSMAFLKKIRVREPTNSFQGIQVTLKFILYSVIEVFPYQEIIQTLEKNRSLSARSGEYCV